MIRPIVIAEYEQTKPNFIKAATLSILVALFLRLAGGGGGILLTLIVLLPNIILGIGAGTFNEEFAKGKLRFLYGLPVSRSGIWLVKCLSGLISVFCMATIICAVLFAFSDDDILHLLNSLPKMGFSSVGLLGALAAICFYGFTVGFFSITLSSSPIVAGIINVVLLYLPICVLGLLFSFLGWGIPLEGFSLIIVVGGCAFLAGSYILFLLRNPFVDAYWVRRIVGVALMGVSLVVMIGGSAVILAWPMSAGQPNYSCILNAIPSPDGEHIFVVTQQTVLQTHGYIISPDGMIEHDLGEQVTAMRNPRMTWRPAQNSPSVAYLEQDLTIFGESISDVVDMMTHQGVYPQDGDETQENDESQQQLTIYQLDARKITRIPYLPSSKKKAPYSYDAWSPDGCLLLADRDEYKGEEIKVTLFSQDAVTGEVRETIIPGKYSYWDRLRNGCSVVHDRFNEDQEALLMTVYGLDQKQCMKIELPPETYTYDFYSDGSGIIYVHKYIEDHTVRYEVVRQDLVTGERSILVEREALPSTTAEQAFRRHYANIDITISLGGRWLTCRISESRPGKEDQHFLIDLQTGQRFMPAELNKKDDGRNNDGYYSFDFSPDETKLLLEHDGYGSGSEKKSEIIVLSFDASRPREIYREEFELRRWNYRWLGENKLFTLRKNEYNQGTLWETNSLWVIDLVHGKSEPITIKPPATGVANTASMTDGTKAVSKR